MTEPVTIKPFDYGNITEEHQTAVNECAKICEQHGLTQMSAMLKQHFKIEEPETYDITDSEIYQLVQGTGIGIHAGGYVHEDAGIRYPFAVLQADVRTFDAWIKNLKEQFRSQ